MKALLDEDERWAAAALASLGAGPARLRRFLDGVDPSAAWRALVDGCHPADPQRAYQDKAVPGLVDRVAAACTAAGAHVCVLGHDGYPASLAGDHEAPAVLFCAGDPTVADALPRVALVGTRRATPYGLGVAAELGRGLAEAGVVVVSGLARGIDTAAHAGAVAVTGGSPPVAVTGTALDADLPRAQRQLRRQVAEAGVVLSELTPGTGGAPAWWFAVRNRVMAALAHVVVVVECHRRGGALHTVRYAVARGVPVTAVPGSVRSPASAGCNDLLVDGAAPARDVDDVLAAVDLATVSLPGLAATRRVATSPRPSAARRPAPDPTAAPVLDVLDDEPATLDVIVRRCGLGLGDAAVALEQLADAGLAVSDGGWWRRALG